ncbi:uncharacterized protein [Pseudochaenichthys georgianus]|uniref:uncharacterized protein n=1 Tax=Pseudochaenichthys georgianus TaxID=52239 RepID=UPI0039C0AD54
MENIDEYIWQRRIHHGVRQQNGTVPFPESVKAGLDFNAALERKDKLDPRLLTNAVMLELCIFARTVTQSEMYFLLEMLDLNFDLGVDLDNDQQYYEYARRAHNKIRVVKNRIRMKTHERNKDKFSLLDISFSVKITANEQPGRYYPKRNKMVDTSVLTDGSRKSAEPQKTEISEVPSMMKRPGGLRVKARSYPYCEDLGVSLFVRPEDAPKDKLDPNPLTNGVMLELLDFSRVLCGTHNGIVHDLIKQNFGTKFDNTFFSLQLPKQLVRKNACFRTNEREAFKKETYEIKTLEPMRRKRKSPDYHNLEELVAIRRRETLRLDDVNADVCPDSDLSYRCPVDCDTEMQLESEAASEHMVSDGCSSEAYNFNPVLPKILPKHTTVKAVSDLYIEEENEDTKVKTLKQKLWMRRAPRSKQILKSSRVNDKFARSREIGLDFNVGSCNKKSLDLQLFTNNTLWEVYKFGTMMSKTVRSFFLEVLEMNFNLVILDHYHELNFLRLMSKEKFLENHPDRQNTEFLNSVFQFPDVVTGVFQTGPEVETLQETSLDSNRVEDMDPHPFCKQLGLNLWSTDARPAGQKMDLAALTNGAVIEIFMFVRELCSSPHRIVYDILEHNFDLGLQSRETMQVIRRWYGTQKRMSITSKGLVTWKNDLVPLSGHAEPEPEPESEPPISNHQQGLDSEDVKPKREALNGGFEKKILSYRICEEIGLDLNIRQGPKTKLDLHLLTRGVLFEMHQYVRQNCNRYIPALYEILEYNFDLSSQNHRKVEFAWSIASQVIAIAGKHGRKGDYLNKVIELPVEITESSQSVGKEEPKDEFIEVDLNDDDDIVFVRELMPVDIDVMID